MLVVEIDVDAPGFLPGLQDSLVGETEAGVIVLAHRQAVALFLCGGHHVLSLGKEGVLHGIARGFPILIPVEHRYIVPAPDPVDILDVHGADPAVGLLAASRMDQHRPVAQADILIIGPHAADAPQDPRVRHIGKDAQHAGDLSLRQALIDDVRSGDAALGLGAGVVVHHQTVGPGRPRFLHRRPVEGVPEGGFRLGGGLRRGFRRRLRGRFRSGRRLGGRLRGGLRGGFRGAGRNLGGFRRRFRCAAAGGQKTRYEKQGQEKG